MLICLCHPATDRDVDACIQDGARSVDDVGEMCGAGTGCGACVDELREQLERAGFSGEADRPRGCPGMLVSVRSRDGNGSPST